MVPKFTGFPPAYSIPLDTSSSSYGVEGRVSPPIKTLTGHSNTVFPYDIKCSFQSLTAFYRSFSSTNLSNMDS